jgi:hypothetical protein
MRDVSFFKTEELWKGHGLSISDLDQIRRNIQSGRELLQRDDIADDCHGMVRHYALTDIYMELLVLHSSLPWERPAVRVAVDLLHAVAEYFFGSWQNSAAGQREAKGMPWRYAFLCGCLASLLLDDTPLLVRFSEWVNLPRRPSDGGPPFSGGEENTPFYYALASTAADGFAHAGAAGIRRVKRSRTTECELLLHGLRSIVEKDGGSVREVLNDHARLFMADHYQRGNIISIASLDASVLYNLAISRGIEVLKLSEPAADIIVRPQTIGLSE